MKSLKLHILLLALVFASCANSAEKEFESVKTEAVSYAKQIEQNQLPTIASNNFQDLIALAFKQSLFSKNYSQLDSLEQFFAHQYQQSHNNIMAYWQSYALFYKALALDLAQDTKTASNTISKAIKNIENLQNKNSEDYALWAYLVSYSMKFESATTQVIKLSKNAKKYASFSQKLNENNPRPYFVLGSLDFYTPEKYGGGKTVEKDLQKAIELPAQEHKNVALPSWGHEQAYELLIKFYLRKNNKEKAIEYFKEAKEKFPHSYTINQLASELI